jgi:putative tryptophan/tyrosine transport system substrate-binding protein
MRRREFITLLGGAAAWPVAARGRQPAMPVIGFLHSGSAAPYVGRMAAFHRGLGETGFVEGKNVAIEYRWAEGSYDRLPALASDLVRRSVSVIVAAGGITSAPAAKAATTTIPIVFTIAADPVAMGLVTSLARPEGNMTGVTWLSAALGAKRLGLLNEMAPNATVVALLLNPSIPSAATVVKEVQEAGRALRLQIQVLGARDVLEIDAALETLVRQGAKALLVQPDPIFTSRYMQIAALGTKLGIPAIYPSREYAEAGGIMSYGPDVSDEYRKAGVYTGRILKGARPADLPIQRPTKFELVINLKTAKALGFEIPPTVLARADEVIE